jgi:hypothetical protein
MSLGEKLDLKLVYLQDYYLVKEQLSNQQNWIKVNKDWYNDFISFEHYQ